MMRQARPQTTERSVSHQGSSVCERPEEGATPLLPPGLGKAPQANVLDLDFEGRALQLEGTAHAKVLR